MSNRPRVFRQTTLMDALDAMSKKGFTVTGAEIRPDGTVCVLTMPIAPLTVEEPNPFDEPMRGQA